MQRIIILMAALLGLISAHANPINISEIPDVLQDWVPWVLYDEQDKLCPFLYQNHDDKRCRWPTKTQLVLTEKGGQFEQQWHIANAQWVPVPGRHDQWPQQLRVNGIVQAVVSQQNLPHVYLTTGTHTVTGDFNWKALPQTLSLPIESGLVSLMINGLQRPFPRIDAKGLLWIQDVDISGNNQVNVTDSVSINVQRHLKDEIPLQATTRIELNIAGAEREILLMGALLDGFIPMQLNSPLPARMEADGRLRVQVKAGQWVLMLQSRAVENVTKLQLPQTTTPWPQEEVWVFEAQTNLRQVTLSGAVGIDPKNTRLPANWQHWPAYQLQAETQLEIDQKQRGDLSQQQDQLSLNRTWWLDFDGQGLSLQDQIRGHVHNRYRLPMNADIQLGRVAVNGEDQFITRLQGDQKQGVELRSSQLDIVADSRWQGTHKLPATGWDADFNNVSAQLNLPPGWRLLAATGIDKSSGSWMAKWTLLDLFLVFIIAASFSHLWGKTWGVVALLGMTLLYHEQGAPIAVWLNVLAASALLKVLPSGRFRVWIQRYFALSVLAVVLISLPFMVQQARQGIYPQLEYPSYKVSAAQPPKAYHAREQDALQRKEMSAMVMEGVEMMADSAAPMKSTYSQRPLAAYDPNTKVQTGPGLPNWQWRSSTLQFSGPVAKDQMIDLWLLSPLENRLLAFARIALLILMIAGVLGWRKKFDLKMLFPMMCAVALTTSMMPTTVMAADAVIPDDKVLTQLKQRLLAAPECVPSCASSETMRLKLDRQQLVIWQTIDAAETVLVPLPGQRGHWSPESVQVDGINAAALQHDQQGRLWLKLDKGQHEIFMSGALPPQAAVQLMLPMKPYHLSTLADDNWQVQGNTRSGYVSDLVLTRLDSAKQVDKQTILTPTSLPAFATVERRLHLGQQWQLETHVTRLTPADSVVQLQIPLLDGEVVTHDGLMVRDGNVQVQLRQGQRDYFWRSILTETPELTLNANQTTDWVESWTLSWGSIWHVQWHGLPLIASNQIGNVMWRPWPGESLMLQVQRPAGEAGQTLTLDQSVLQVRPGQRSSDMQLNMTLRSSLGQQHTMSLPDEAQLTEVLIQGNKIPLELIDNNLTLPINPGEQQIQVKWQQDSAMTMMFSSPQTQIGLNGVNHEIEIFMPDNRWILAVGGPNLGPAVLMWGVLLVLVLVAIGLGRLSLTPLKAHHWILLLIGLTQASMMTLAIVVGWMLALGWRAKRPWQEDRAGFNLVQIGLGLWTIVALSSLFFAIEQGLLGQPEMQIVGNGSYRHYLHWYQDHSAEILPQAWVLSLPLFVYRTLMLLWALWLAFALMGWLRWGWQCFSRDGIWRHVKLTIPTGSWGSFKKKTEDKDES